MSTTTVPLVSGGAPVPIQVAGNSPQGYALINPDRAATVTVTAGATGPAIAALQPGGQLVWRDPAVYPYAYATGGAGTVVLVVTDQASDYSNPAAVAAVTAAQLAQQGIPNTFTDGGLGTYFLHPGSSSAPINVGQYGSLLVSANWPQPPAASAAFTMTFSDPAVPDFTPVSLWGSNDNTAEQSVYTWQVPVLAPVLTITNVVNDRGDIPGYFSVIGNNRTVPRFRQVGDETGVRHLNANVGVGSQVKWPLVPTNYATSVVYGSDSVMTRFNGPVQITTNSGMSTGYLFMVYADNHGNQVQQPIRLPVAGGVNFLTGIAHPSVPVHWYVRADTPPASGTVPLAFDIAAAY